MTDKDKRRKASQKSVLSGGTLPFVRSYHAVPFNNMNEILPGFGAIDNDLAVENMKNDFDLTAADIEDFRKHKKD